MPLYTYSCPVCSEEIEKMSTIDDRDNQECDSCKNPLIRLVDIPRGVYAPTSGKGLA